MTEDRHMDAQYSEVDAIIERGHSLRQGIRALQETAQYKVQNRTRIAQEEETTFMNKLTILAGVTVPLSVGLAFIDAMAVSGASAWGIVVGALATSASLLAFRHTRRDSAAQSQMVGRRMISFPS